MAHGEVLWEPPGDVRSTSEIGRYLGWLERTTGRTFEDYDALWRWSVDDLAGFWASVWNFFEIGEPVTAPDALADRRMPGAVWFPGRTVNYAEVALRASGGTAVVSVSQTRPDVVLTFDELRSQVARAQAGLRRLGVTKGDRVVAYLPNIAEALVAFLATASLGAVWASCPPEFGTASVVARFQQIDPAVLIAVDGYRYGTKAIDRTAEVAAIRAALPGLRHTVVLPYLDPGRAPETVAPGATGWADLTAPVEADTPTFEPLPFDHPLYVLYSSGTTGLPKPIVHGHGGITVEHLKALALHGDVRAGDRFFWFSTTGWMMWNFLASSLLVGATVVAFDGDPAHPDLLALWRLAASTRLTFLGTSAGFVQACRKADLHPGRDLDLSALRSVGSTGSPLTADGFEWIHDAVGAGVNIASISGGTDVCSAFVGGSPMLPVRAGVIACRYLGAKVEAFDEDGRPVVGELGELVITEPMPSMPVGFWADPDGSRYRASYFERYPGIWRHGDWITIAEDGSCVITGRSDATLNRGGVRLGTAEFYGVVEGLDEIADSLVVHLEDADGGPGRLVLFVVPKAGADLDDGLRARIADSLRRSLSPRHVPDELHAVRAVPRTLSGKKLELPVKRILLGTPPAEAASRDSLADPTALDDFARLAQSRD